MCLAIGVAPMINPAHVFGSVVAGGWNCHLAHGQGQFLSRKERGLFGKKDGGGVGPSGILPNGSSVDIDTTARFKSSSVKGTSRPFNASFIDGGGAGRGWHSRSIALLPRVFLTSLILNH